MMAVGEAGLGVIAFAGTALLTLGLGGLVLVKNRQMKVHAMALGAIGPVLVLATAPAWAEGRMVLTALLLSAFLLLTSAVSGHAIMMYLDAQRRWSSQRPGGRSDGAPRSGESEQS